MKRGTFENVPNELKNFNFERHDRQFVGSNVIDDMIAEIKRGPFIAGRYFKGVFQPENGGSLCRGKIL